MFGLRNGTLCNTRWQQTYVLLLKYWSQTGYVHRFRNHLPCFNSDIYASATSHRHSTNSSFDKTMKEAAPLNKWSTQRIIAYKLIKSPLRSNGVQTTLGQNVNQPSLYRLLKTNLNNRNDRDRKSRPHAPHQNRNSLIIRKKIQKNNCGQLKHETF